MPFEGSNQRSISLCSKFEHWFLINSKFKIFNVYELIIWVVLYDVHIKYTLFNKVQNVNNHLLMHTTHLLKANRINFNAFFCIFLMVLNRNNPPKRLPILDCKIYIFKHQKVGDVTLFNRRGSQWELLIRIDRDSWSFSNLFFKNFKTMESLHWIP